MKKTLTAIALAALAATAYAASEITDQPHPLCMPAALQTVLS